MMIGGEMKKSLDVSDWIWNGRRGIIDLGLWRACLMRHYEKSDHDASLGRVLKLYIDHGGRLVPNKWERRRAGALPSPALTG